MELWELAARESIRDLVARYNASGDSGRLGPMLELFAHDATLEVPGETLHGVAAIRAFLERVSSRTDARTDTGTNTGTTFIRHFVSTHQIDFESETEASGRAYYVVFTDSGPDHWGRYLDRYRRIDGHWRFWHRIATVDAAEPGGWAAPC